MAGSEGNRQLKQLQAENKRLREDNKSLRNRLKSAGPVGRNQFGSASFLRTLGIVLSLGLATAVLLVGNLLFWAGNTVVKTDRYVTATAPLIKNAEIQDALANTVSSRLLGTVNVEELAAQALPPRLDFLAPTLADQVQNRTTSTVKSILQRPQFQDRWNAAQRRQHERFIRLIKEHGSDGAIDLSEVYSDISQDLKGTKLSFLADKPLPSKVGNIQLVSGRWISVLQQTIQNIDTWRIVAVGLLLVLSAVSIWLSRNRRKTVVVLSSLFALSMLLTALSLRVLREIVAGKAQPQNAEAVRQAYGIVIHSLQVQTLTILGVAVVAVVIAWVSGQSSGAHSVKAFADKVFAGKLHGAIFSSENSFTRWLSGHKALLEWLCVIVVAVIGLVVRLTPRVLLAQIIAIIVLVLLVELLAAKPEVA